MKEYPIQWKNSPEAVKKHIEKHILGETTQNDTRTVLEREMEKLLWKNVFCEEDIKKYRDERSECNQLFADYKTLPEEIINGWTDENKNNSGIWCRHIVQGYTSYNYWLNDQQGNLSHLLIAVRPERGAAVIPTCFFSSSRPRGEEIVNTAAVFSRLGINCIAYYPTCLQNDNGLSIETNDSILKAAIEYAKQQNINDNLKVYAFLARIYFFQYMELTDHQKTKKILYKNLIAKCEKKAFGNEISYDCILSSGEKSALRRRKNLLKNAIDDSVNRTYFEIEREEDLYEYILISSVLGDGAKIARDYVSFDGQNNVKRQIWEEFIKCLDI